MSTNPLGAEAVLSRLDNLERKNRELEARVDELEECLETDGSHGLVESREVVTNVPHREHRTTV